MERVLVKEKKENVKHQPGDHALQKAKAYAFQKAGNKEVFLGIVYGTSHEKLYELTKRDILSYPSYATVGDSIYCATYIITDEVKAKKQIADLEWIKVVKSISKLYPKNSMHVIQYFRHKRLGEKKGIEKCMERIEKNYVFIHKNIEINITL